MEKTNKDRAKDADNYHYFAWDNGGGVSGIAGLGTVCLSSRRPRTAVSEWIGNADSRYAENQCMIVSHTLCPPLLINIIICLRYVNIRHRVEI